MEEKLRSFGYLIPSHLSQKADATKSKFNALTALYDRLEATLATTDAIRARLLGAPHTARPSSLSQTRSRRQRNEPSPRLN